jgi:hypothetical protein
MTKYIRKYQKALLAIFGVALMIIFIIPSSFKNGRNFADHEIGKIGDKPLYESEKDQAEREWKILSGMRQPNGQGQAESISALALGNALSSEIEDKPLLFLLLQKEAAQQGVIADSRMVAQYAGSEQGPEADERRQAVQNLFLVLGLRQRLANAIKDSAPIETHELAKYAQKTRLSVVTFRAEQFKSAVPTPTMDQLRKMYDSLSHVPPAPADTAVDNPYLPPPPAPPTGDSLGFGYQLPRRVKVQYIEIPRQTLLDVVAKKKSPYDWDVAAREYYYSHEADFPTTHPGTNPATEPMTQPYVETKQQILDQLRGPDADTLAAKVKDAILTRLDQGYAQHVASQPATKPGSSPTTAAASALAGVFGSEQYLEQITFDIQKEFGVLPIVREVTELEGASDLSLEIGIGQAKAPDQTAFADYAIGSDDPSAKSNMEVYEPSTWLSDPSENNYIFRLTAIAPAAPAPFHEVQSTVTEDWVTQQAYDKALAAAKGLSTKSENKLLHAVAQENHLPAFETEFFQPESQTQGPPIPGTVVDPKAQSKVADEAETLLTLATEQDPHPIGIVPVPALRSVIVVQLADTQLSFRPGDLWRQELADYAQYNQRAAQYVSMQYFTYDAVTKRMGYVPAPGEKGT